MVLVVQVVTSSYVHDSSIVMSVMRLDLGKQILLVDRHL